MQRNENEEEIGQRPILTLMKSQGHEIDEGGMCFGISIMAIFAATLKDLKTFNLRIKEINELHDTVEGNESDASIGAPVDILAFFDGVASIHQSKKYKEVYSAAENSKIQDWKPALAAIMPVKLEKQGGLETIGQFSGLYSIVDMFKLLLCLRDSFRASNDEDVVSFLIHSGNHAITLAFDPTARQFYLIDPNHLPAKTFSTEGEDLKLLALKLFSYLRFKTRQVKDLDVNNDRIPLYAEIFCSGSAASNRKREVLSMVQDDEFWKELHDINSDNPRVKEAGYDKTTWLHLAVSSDNLEEVAALLVTEPGKKVINKAGWHLHTPLGLACLNNNERMVELLLQNGADPNLSHADQNGLPLQLAIIMNNSRLVDLLIKYGANINAIEDSEVGITALQRAATQDDLNIARQLLAAGANPLIRGRAGLYAYQVCKNQESTVCKLIRFYTELEALKNNITSDTSSFYGKFNFMFSGNQLKIATTLQDVLSGKKSIKELDHFGSQLEKDQFQPIVEFCKKLSELSNASSSFKHK